MPSRPDIPDFAPPVVADDLRVAIMGAVPRDRQSWRARIDHILVGDFVIGRAARRYAALALLIVASVCGFMDYTIEGGGWIWSTGPTVVSLRPDMQSGLMAVLLVLPLYLRRVLELSHSVYFYLSLLLNITITAILLQALLGQAAPWLTRLPMPYVLGFAIIMTWTGMRPFALLFWGGVVVLGLINLQAASAAMGLFGYLFIICAFLGVILQVEPNLGSYATELRYDFMGDPRVPRAINAVPVSGPDHAPSLLPTAGAPR